MIIPGQFGFNCPSGFREEAFWNIFPRLHLSGHYIFSIKFEAFFLQTKIYPTLQKLNGQISNIVLNKKKIRER